MKRDNIPKTENGLHLLPKGTPDWDVFLNENFQKLEELLKEAGTSEEVTEILENLAKVATSGNYNDLSNTPSLFSGDYNDLKNKPAISSGNKYITIVIGHEDSGYTQNDVDYLYTNSDDGTVINNAISALPSTGGTILLLEGTYKIKKTISLKAGVSLKGVGEGTVITPNTLMASMVEVTYNDNTIENIYFKGANGSSPVSRAVNFSNCYNFKLSNCKFSNIEATSGTPPCVRTYNATRGEITGNTIVGSNGIFTGIRVDEISSEIIISNNIIIGCYIGIEVQQTAHSYNITIVNNNLKDNDYGIRLTGNSSMKIGGMLILGNTVTTSKDVGIFLTYIINSIIADNIVHSNNGGGILVAESENISIEGNSSRGNVEAGICVNNSKGITLTGNTIAETGGSSGSYNLYLYGSTNVVVSGNSCLKVAGASSCAEMFVLNCNRVNITGNLCEMNTLNNRVGMHIQNGNDFTVTGNIVIKGTGASAGYGSNDYTIILLTGGNHIIGNNIVKGKDVSNISSSSVTMVNNKI